MKNQIKKSLSFLMAVLMILSCWVWVAPEIAEAAAPNSYDITVEYWVNGKSWGFGGPADEIRIRAWTRSGNGTASEEVQQDQYGSGSCVGENKTGTYTATYTHWPSRIWVEAYEKGSGIFNSSTFDVDIKSIKINDKTVWKGNVQLRKESGDGGVGANWYPNTQNDADADGKSGSVSGGGEHSGFEWNWPRPVISEASASISPESVTLTELGTTKEQTSTVTVGGIKDQYGVNWTGTKDITFALRAETGITLDSHASITDNGDNATVTVKPSIQKLYPEKSSATLYIDWNLNKGVKSNTLNLTLNFPTYEITFDANGGKIGDAENSTGDTVVISDKKYGETIGKSPSYRNKNGFDFVGFYSEDYSDATGLTNSFDNNKKFVDNETKVPEAGDATYYAAWKAKPITATFLTQDNQLIGTVEGRYGNYLTNSNMYNGLKGLNTAVKASHTAGKVQFDGNDAPIYKDGSSTYTFSHWQVVKGYDDAIVDAIENGNGKHAVLYGDVTFKAVYVKADATKYAVKFYDGNGNLLKDKNGNAYSKDDYKFREPVIMPSDDPSKAQDDKYKYEFIGWANKLEGVNFFAVDENNKDESGALIAYTAKEAAEFTVRGDAEYIPVFRMIPREYNVTFKYKIDGGNNATVVVGGYHLGDTPVLPEEIKDNYTATGFRFPLIGWYVGDESTDVKKLSEIKIDGDTILNATYGGGVAAKYTINFYDKDGNLVNDENNIYSHMDSVTAPTVGDGEGYDIPLTIETEDSRYTFKEWSPTVNTKATADAEYRAQYTKQDYADIQFFNYDETPLTNVITGNFVGDKIPADAYTDTPVKPEDAVGEYNFIGWSTKVNAENKDDIINLDTYELTGDTKLYAQYETKYKNYTVKFLNDDGSVFSEKTYHYATPIEIPDNPSKAPDETYTYEFRAWTPEVSAVCYGDATYTATYRRAYNYYKVTWLNEDKTVYTSSSYTYNARINPASISKAGDAGEGHTWGFSHWVQCDENGNDILVNGNQVIFTRGMKMPATKDGLYFYPVFIPVANAITVTFHDADGNEIGSADFNYNSDISEYRADFIVNAITKPDETYHYDIVKFVELGGNEESPAIKNVKADIDVQMIVAGEEHNKTVEEILVESTYNVHGYANYTCEAEGCGQADLYVELPLLVDNTAPTGQVKVGVEKWESTDFGSIDYSDITYIAPNTSLIASVEDANRGISKLYYYVHEMDDEGAISDVTTISEADWVEFYNYDSIKAAVLEDVLEDFDIDLETYQEYCLESAAGEDKLTKAYIDRAVEAELKAYKANGTTSASSLGLVDGKEYVIYIKAADTDPDGKAGRLPSKSNITVFSTGTVSYGTQAAEITVSGDGFGTKLCADASVKISDDCDGFKVYLDGEEKAVTITKEEGKFVAKLTEATKGLHTITVEDKHGNKTVKIFEIKGGHSYRGYKIAATCTTDGSEYKLCTVCGATSAVKTLPKLGHSYTTNYTEKAATCTADGSRTYVCDNNCGTTNTVKYKKGKFEGDLEFVKIWVPDESNDEGGAFRAATEADFIHLKALNDHVYEKDENGKDVWIVDKAPTCKKGDLGAGKQHKTCTICGYTVEEIIPRDADAHKFYSDSLTKEAKCTEEGEITRTCRYCGKSELVEKVPALGHIAENGNYEVIVKPTCEAKGTKILLCDRCEEQIGEAKPDGSFDISKTVEIPALGHAWVKDGKIEKTTDATTGEEIYVQYYKCNNGCNETKFEVLEDYVEPKKVTFTFTNGTDVQTIEKYVGESIIETEVEKPSKAADSTYKYTFAAWVDAEGKEVSFPIEVKEGAAYTATFANKYINYTITYYRDDGTEYKKTGYLHNGEEVKLADGPAKAETLKHTYKFAGWMPVGSDVVCGKTVKIDGANINLKATYTETSKTYKVFYAKSNDDYFEIVEVVAGDAAREISNEFKAELVKDYNTKYHYTFDGWNEAEALESVERDIYTTPEFKAVEHSFTKTVKSAATCKSNEVVVYSCSACGYSYEVNVSGTMLDHDWGDPVPDAETGKEIIICQTEGCGESKENDLTYTIKFFKNATDSKPVHTEYYVPWGDTIKAPTAPTKESDSATVEHKFIGWVDMATNELYTEEQINAIAITKEYNFVAKFETITINYNVTFGYPGEDYAIKTVYNAVGPNATEAEIFALYGNDPEPTKNPDEKHHYTFAGWKIDEIKGNKIRVIATFNSIKHDTTNVIELNEATCTNAMGTRYWCNCNGSLDDNGKPAFDEMVNGEYVDYYYDKTVGETKDHSFVVVDEVPATPEADGYIDYECSVCHTTKRETNKYVDNKISIQVKVLHNGAAQSNVQVIIMEKKASAIPEFITTNANGVATTTGVKDVQYAAYVTIDGKEIEVTLNADASGNLSATYNHVDKAVSCTCACHRNNFWGTIFRFFHKIIKLFTGEFKCCGNPDPMYG